MTRINRDFQARPTAEREGLLEDTWCNSCGKADLGMDSPREYEENGRIYVEGMCRNCRCAVWSEIIEEDVG